MSIVSDTCSLCRGSGKAERLEELSFSDEWVHNTMVPEHMWNALAASMPSVVRLATVECPKCNGTGSYLVETFACKIF